MVEMMEFDKISVSRHTHRGCITSRLHRIIQQVLHIDFWHRYAEHCQNKEGTENTLRSDASVYFNTKLDYCVHIRAILYTYVIYA